MRRISNKKVKNIKRFCSYNYTEFKSFEPDKYNFRGQAVSYLTKNIRSRIKTKVSILKDYLSSPNSYNRALFHPGDRVWIINDHLKIVEDVIESVRYHGPVGNGSLITYTLLDHSCGSSGDCEHGDLFRNRKEAEFYYTYVRIHAIKYTQELHSI